MVRTTCRILRRSLHDKVKMKKLIINIIDVDEETALECVKQCVETKSEDCVWTFTKPYPNNEKIIVFDKINKSSITYTVYKEENNEVSNI